MSIHDLMEKINAPPERGRPSVIGAILIGLALVGTLSGWGMAIYMVKRLKTPAPITIECSEEILKSLEATSSLQSLLKPRAEGDASVQGRAGAAPGSAVKKPVSKSPKKSVKKTASSTKKQKASSKKKGKTTPAAPE